MIDSPEARGAIAPLPGARPWGPSAEVLSGWGMAHSASALVYRPHDPEEVALAIRDARERGRTVALRGAGLSYGDASLADRGAVILMSGLDAPPEVDPISGTLRAHAGNTIEQLWKAALPHGFWIPVVPGSIPRIFMQTGPLRVPA